MRSIVIAPVLALVAACGAPPPPPAAPVPDVQTRDVSYEQDGTSLRGLLAWDANRSDARPGVLVVHEWWGHDEFARTQARRLAEAGYVGFALDMYGEGVHAEHAADAERLSGESLADREVMTARFNAARAALERDPHVDPAHIAAIGYCYGGAVVLSLARTGADLDAVASFHGVLQGASPAEPGAVTARVLVLTGGDDPMVPPEAVDAFRAEMTAAGADFRIVTYPGAKHSFTNPDAGSHGMPELAYDEAAAAASWQEMLALFNEVFR